MVHVTVRTKNQQINCVTINGHAKYDQFGKDIVCAGISAIVFGTLNALQELADQLTVKVEQLTELNEIRIVVKQTNQINQIILKTMLLQLKTIAESYQPFLQIKEVS